MDILLPTPKNVWMMSFRHSDYEIILCYEGSPPACHFLAASELQIHTRQALMVFASDEYLTIRVS